MNNLGHLPIEIIFLIINHTNKISFELYNYLLVNKQFYTATIPLLWRTLTVNNETSFTKIGTGLLTSPQSLGQHVRHLKLCELATDLQLLLLLKHIPSLETLEIRSTPGITDKSLHHVARYCPNLTSVTLLLVPISTHSIISLAQHCRRLCKLELENTHDLSPAIFQALAHCPLKELVLIAPFRCVRDADDPDWLTGLNVSSSCLHQLSGLTRLKMDSFTSAADIGATILQTPLAWPHLTQLYLCGCRDITTTQLDAFFQSHPMLHSLELNGVPRTTDTLASIARHLARTIRSLSLDSHAKIKPRALRQFVHQCPFLVYLCFWDRVAFSKDDFLDVFDEDDDEDDVGKQVGCDEIQLFGYRFGGPVQVLRGVINKIRLQPAPDDMETSDDDDEDQDQNENGDQDDHQLDGNHWIPLLATNQQGL